MALVTEFAVRYHPVAWIFTPDIGMWGNGNRLEMVASHTATTPLPYRSASLDRSRQHNPSSFGKDRTIAQNSTVVLKPSRCNINIQQATVSPCAPHEQDYYQG